MSNTIVEIKSCQLGSVKESDSQLVLELVDICESITPIPTAIGSSGQTSICVLSTGPQSIRLDLFAGEAGSCLLSIDSASSTATLSPIAFVGKSSLTTSLFCATKTTLVNQQAVVFDIPLCDKQTFVTINQDNPVIELELIDSCDVEIKSEFVDIGEVGYFTGCHSSNTISSFVFIELSCLVGVATESTLEVPIFTNISSTMSAGSYSLSDLSCVSSFVSNQQSGCISQVDIVTTQAIQVEFNAGTESSSAFCIDLSGTIFVGETCETTIASNLLLQGFFVGAESRTETITRSIEVDGSFFAGHVQTSWLYVPDRRPIISPRPSQLGAKTSVVLIPEDQTVETCYGQSSQFWNDGTELFQPESFPLCTNTIASSTILTTRQSLDISVSFEHGAECRTLVDDTSVMFFVDSCFSAEFAVDRVQHLCGAPPAYIGNSIYVEAVDVLVCSGVATGYTGQTCRSSLSTTQSFGTKESVGQVMSLDLKLYSPYINLEFKVGQIGSTFIGTDSTIDIMFFHGVDSETKTLSIETAAMFAGERMTCQLTKGHRVYDICLDDPSDDPPAHGLVDDPYANHGLSETFTPTTTIHSGFSIGRDNGFVVTTTPYSVVTIDFFTKRKV